jgi:hypothetical protein
VTGENTVQNCDRILWVLHRLHGNNYRQLCQPALEFDRYGSMGMLPRILARTPELFTVLLDERLDQFDFCQILMHRRAGI